MSSHAHRHALRLAWRIAGFAVFSGGLILAVTPIPLGGAAAALGVAMLIPVSGRVRRFVLHERQAHAWLDRMVTTCCACLPERARRAVELTRARPQ
ncbi:MAG: hypothetical protein ACOC05_10920 [Oceanicaulis sp.]